MSVLVTSIEVLVLAMGVLVPAIGCLVLAMGVCVLVIGVFALAVGVLVWVSEFLSLISSHALCRRKYHFWTTPTVCQIKTS
jgi:hypothetical protein